MFLYVDLQWTTGDYSLGRGGLGGTHIALGGFTAGDRINFYTIPGSRTPNITNLTITSNVGIPGTRIFRVGQGNIIPYGAKFWWGKTWANLVKRMPFANVLPTRFTKVANAGYCNFANIFLAKILNNWFVKVLSLQNFALYSITSWCYTHFSSVHKIYKMISTVWHVMLMLLMNIMGFWNYHNLTIQISLPIACVCRDSPSFTPRVD